MFVVFKFFKIECLMEIYGYPQDPKPQGMPNYKPYYVLLQLEGKCTLC